VVNHDHDLARLREVAARLDRLRDVPTDVLIGIVRRGCVCPWAFALGDPPAVTGADAPDRELAALLCAECTHQDECLELDLRMAGPAAVGVFGGLSETDRRALYPLWHARRGGGASR
jgi:WhiB family redox-sensing transcriptional regulator